MASDDELSAESVPTGGSAKKFRANREVQKWLNHFAAYDREFRKWEGRVEKIIKRYRDDTRSQNTSGHEARFNILWSNVQTLLPAVFARLPKPQVTRRFNDSDPIARIAGLILERGLDYEVQHYPDYAATLRQVILDRFLGGRGCAWSRYEPHMKAARLQVPTDGLEVTEDVDTPDEELDYECAPVDYVHWKDFGHTVARTWEEVTAVWRCVYMSREQLRERFPEWADKIPMDARPEDLSKSDYSGGSGEEYTRAKIYEIWDKSTKQVLWLSKGVKKIIDEVDDPLGFEEFWPCPRPLFATLTNDSLVPVPDFALYQDQANELDLLNDRIDSLVKALKVCGVYDASQTELQRLFTESESGTLIPVKNWAAFSEKNGLQGTIDIVDLDPIARALKESYAAFEAIKNQVYELTGISDIVRGQTIASETATAQQIKSQYASLRLKMMQTEVAQFASELIKAKAQVICNKFDPSTLAQIAAVDQMKIVPSDAQGLLPPPQPPAPPQPGMPPPPPPQPPSEQQIRQVVIGKAMELLFGPRLQDPDSQAPNPLRCYRIEVASDSLLQIDDREEKESRAEFIGAVGGTLKNLEPVMLQMPALAPLVLELIRFAAQAYKTGRPIEGVFDQAIEQVRQQMSQPKPDPEQQKAQMEMQKLQAEMQAKQKEQEMNLQHEQQKHQFEMQADIQKHELEMKNQHEQAMFDRETARSQHQDQMLMERQKMALQAQPENVPYDASGKPQDTPAQQMASIAQRMEQMMQMMLKFLEQQAQQGKRGRRLSRDPVTGEKVLLPM